MRLKKAYFSKHLSQWRQPRGTSLVLERGKKHSWSSESNNQSYYTFHSSDFRSYTCKCRRSENASLYELSLCSKVCWKSEQIYIMWRQVTNKRSMHQVVTLVQTFELSLQDAAKWCRWIYLHSGCILYWMTLLKKTLQSVTSYCDRSSILIAYQISLSTGVQVR